MAKIVIEKTDDDQLTLKVHAPQRGSRASTRPAFEMELTEAQLDHLYAICKAGIRANVFRMSQET